MVYRKRFPVRLAAIFFVPLGVVPIANQWVSGNPALAQSLGESPEGFPIPNALPEGTTLKVDGSTSMRVTNEALEARFEAQFPDADVQLDASRTDEALAALIAGEIDVIAAGRPLTEAEKAQGLVEVPIEREKLAIVLGPENPFDGTLSFEQFAQIFRGEITNWSEVGGPDVPIRLVDRPDYSDTRRALSTYTVFNENPFVTGDTADPVATDETDAVVAALGADGIGYAVVSQVIDREDVRILSMHQTLPDDPRYPYSQYRGFVTREAASPAALAFLGLATTLPGQEMSTEAAAAPTAESEIAESEIAESEAAESDVGSETAESETDPAAADTEATATPSSELSEASEAETALVPGSESTREVARGGLSGWLWLLGIPILGGLLWWWLKRNGEDEPAAVAGTPTPIAPVAETEPAPQVVLTPGTAGDITATWGIPSDRLEDIKRQGGEMPIVRLYDVTDCPPDAPLPAPINQFEYAENESHLSLPIAADDRDYLAEVGYLTADQRWLPMARSAPTRMPAAGAARPPLRTEGVVPETDLSGANTSRIVFTPRAGQMAVAAWDVPEAARAALKAEGGQDYQLRIYDVTDINLDKQPPHDTLIHDVAETERDREVLLPVPNRDYIAEIGYRAEDGGWFDLARSIHIRLPAAYETTAIAEGLGAAVSVATTPPVTRQCAIKTVKVSRRDHALQLNAGQIGHLQTAVAVTHLLEPGLHILRIRDGAFNYNGHDAHPGEPFVLLWLYGGTVINPKTRVPVSSTWSTLNGYGDTLTLEVQAPTTLSAFFLDTFPDDNVDHVTLSVIQL
ncbi:MAG: DUF4912 domain-containing protein [Leptolyngbya sp. SIO1E4]|nr:DUF4912 domain-containing protein [Leptolyngbya sp. SIO1E4]